MKFNKKIIVSAVLVIAIGAAEVFGIMLCRNMIPDFKNEIFEESKSDTTQLMFINDEDSLRFYPWLSYDETSCISFRKYFENEMALYNAEIGEEEYAKGIKDIAEKSGEEFDENKFGETEMKKAYEYKYQGYKDRFNMTVRRIIETFDGDKIAPDDMDFSGSVLIDEEKSIAYIQGFEYTDMQRQKHILDLVFGADNAQLRFYRLRESTDKTFSSTEITAKSSDIMNDLNDSLPILEKYFISGVYTEYPYDYWESDEYEDDAVEKKEENITEIGSGNIITEFLGRIENSKTEIGFDSYDDVSYMVTFYGIDDTESYGDEYSDTWFFMDLPQYSTEYNIFSNGDELMIVLGSGPRESSTILYYSLSSDRITGISIGKN